MKGNRNFAADCRQPLSETSTDDANTTLRRRCAPRDRHEYRNLVLSEHGPKTAHARLVAVALTQCMDGKTMESRAGQPLLARLTALSERTVRDALAELREEGWVQERPGAKPWQRIRRAMIPDSVPANSAGTHGANGGEAPANSAGTDDHAPADSAGTPPANGSKAPADFAGGTGKFCQKAPADSAAYPVLRDPVLDPVQDPVPGAASPSPAKAVSAALEAKSDEVGRLAADGFAPEEIARHMRLRGLMCSTREVKRLLAEKAGGDP